VEDFTTGQRSTIGPVNLASIDASDIIFYIAGGGSDGKGTPVVDIGKQGTIDATVYVKTGRLVLRNGTIARGAFFATDVDIGVGAMVTYNSFFGNEPPVAEDDAYSTDEDTLLTVIVPGVLSNDSDADGDPLSAVLVNDVDNGALTLSSNGSFTYTPVANYHGFDSFTYKANDGTADSNTATVSLTIKQVNDPPTDISLDNNTVIENDAGAIIGTLSVTDVDVVDTHTFSINDPRFEAIGSQLKLKTGESLG
jgi:VCBS repeat-containing protein